MECYVFETNEQAQSALDYINNNGAFPYSGKNALTGEIIPNQTTKWVNEYRLRVTDGKPYFPRLPQARITELTQEQVNYFLTTFQPTIETFEAEWLPVEEE